MSRGTPAWQSVGMDHETLLRKIADRYHERRRESETERRALADAIRAATGAGMRQVEIVKATGYTREQVRLIAAGRTR